jgi:hypothetical protein
MPDDDLNSMAKEDLRNARRMAQGSGRSWTAPAIIEAALLTLTGFVALGWIIALFYTPSPIPSEVWLFGGLFAMACFGGPTALVYMVRRGGLKAITRAMRGV